MKKKTDKIPKNLNECIKTLKKSLPKSNIEKLKNGEITAISMHHTLGTWMRNSWGLWGDSELKKWFNNIGIMHPDDMSGIILRCLVCSMKKEPFDLQEQVKHYQGYWEKIGKIKKNKDGSCSYNIKINKDGEVEIV